MNLLSVAELAQCSQTEDELRPFLTELEALAAAWPDRVWPALCTRNPVTVARGSSCAEHSALRVSDVG